MTEPTCDWIEADDPWIDAYMRFRQCVLAGEVTTFAEVEEFAAEAKRGLPGGAPSIPAAMFITADVAIAFPGASSPELMIGLWVPDDVRIQMKTEMNRRIG